MDVRKIANRKSFWNSRWARGMWGEKWEFYALSFKMPLSFFYMKVSLLIFSLAFLFSSEGF